MQWKWLCATHISKGHSKKRSHIWIHRSADGSMNEDYDRWLGALCRTMIAWWEHCEELPHRWWEHYEVYDRWWEHYEVYVSMMGPPQLVRILWSMMGPIMRTMIDDGTPPKFVTDYDRWCRSIPWGLPPLDDSGALWPTMIDRWEHCAGLWLDDGSIMRTMNSMMGALWGLPPLDDGSIVRTPSTRLPYYIVTKIID